jgi:tetratricopeptide (TPR) repeat protein
VAFARAAWQCFACSEQESGQALIARVNASEASWRGDPRARGFVEGARGFQAMCAAFYETATRHNFNAIDAFLEAGDARNACLARTDLSYTMPMLGAHEEAERHLRGAINEARRMGMHAAARMTGAWLALSLVQVGRLDEALALAEEAVDPLDAELQPRVACIARTALGVARWHRGELARAESELRSAMDLLGDSAFTVRILPWGYLARLRVVQGAADDALALALAATAQFDPARGLACHEGPARLALVEAYLALGRADEARAALHTAIARRQETLAAIETPAYRESFVTRVASNRRLTELERELSR